MEDNKEMDVDKGLKGNELIEQKIELLKSSFTEENLAVVLSVIRSRIKENGQFVVAVAPNDGPANSFALRTANYNNKKWFVAYTSFDEEMKGDQSVMSGFMAEIDKLLEIALKSEEVEGIIINPYGNMMTMNKSIISLLVN